MRLKRFDRSLRAAAIALLALAAPAHAQSTDRDNPTRLAAAELRGEGPGRPVENYYLFVGGPGDVLLTVEARARQFSTGIRVDLFDAENTKVVGASVIATPQGARDARRVTLTKRGTLLMRVSLDENAGPYLVRIGGAIELAVDDSAGRQRQNAPPPAAGQAPPVAGRKGRIRIELSDGSAQEFDLSRVQRIIIEP